MKRCPYCKIPMKKTTKEISNGVYAEVTVCPKCENDDLFQRKAFKAGGSLAVRLPKEIVNNLGISEGCEINFKVYPQGVMMKVNGIKRI